MPYGRAASGVITAALVNGETEVLVPPAESYRIDFEKMHQYSVAGGRNRHCCCFSVDDAAASDDGLFELPRPLSFVQLNAWGKHHLTPEEVARGVLAVKLDESPPSVEVQEANISPPASPVLSALPVENDGSDSDFGDFDEAPAIPSESIPVNLSPPASPVVSTLPVEDGGSDSDFGDFDEAPPAIPSETVVDETTTPASTDNEDFDADFGDFDEAPPAIPSETVVDETTSPASISPPVENYDDDFDADFGDFDEASPASAETVAEAPALHATDSQPPADVGFEADFGDFDEAPSIPTAPTLATNCGERLDAKTLKLVDEFEVLCTVIFGTVESHVSSFRTERRRTGESTSPSPSAIKKEKWSATVLSSALKDITNVNPSNNGDNSDAEDIGFEDILSPQLGRARSASSGSYDSPSRSPLASPMERRNSRSDSFDVFGGGDTLLVAEDFTSMTTTTFVTPSKAAALSGFELSAGQENNVGQQQAFGGMEDFLSGIPDSTATNGINGDEATPVTKALSNLGVADFASGMDRIAYGVDNKDNSENESATEAVEIDISTTTTVASSSPTIAAATSTTTKAATFLANVPNLAYMLSGVLSLPVLANNEEKGSGRMSIDDAFSF